MLQLCRCHRGALALALKPGMAFVRSPPLHTQLQAPSPSRCKHRTFLNVLLRSVRTLVRANESEADECISDAEIWVCIRRMAASVAQVVPLPPSYCIVIDFQTKKASFALDSGNSIILSVAPTSPSSRAKYPFNVILAGLLMPPMVLHSHVLLKYILNYV